MKPYREFLSVASVLFTLLTVSLSITYLHQSTTKIVICFDDAPVSHYNVAFPKMREKGFVGVLFVPTAMISEGWSDSDHLSWSQLREMYEAGWEIGSHTVNHPDLTKQTENVIVYELSESKKSLRAHGFYVRSFATPFKANNQTVHQYVRKYYDFDRLSCNFPQSNGDWKNVTDFIEMNRGSIIVFGFHSIEENPTSKYDCPTQDFENFINWLANKKTKGEICVLSFSQAMDLERAQVFSNIICFLCVGSLPILYKFSPILRSGD